MPTKIAKWGRWLDQIKQQTYDVMGRRHIYQETLEIVRENRSLPATSAFYTWLHVCYADAAVMAIRRQVKVDRQAISLAGLLTDIQQNPEVLSRKHWLHLFSGHVLEPYAASQFDGLTSPGAEHIDPAMVSDDLNALRDGVRVVEAWSDRRVAHFDRGEAPPPPTFEDIDGALDSLDRLLRKYYLLVTADNIVSTTPIIQHNWKAVFQHAWRPAEHI